MFIRKVKNQKGVAYLQIAETYRKEGKVKQRILFSLGRLEKLQETGELDNMAKALSHYCERQKLVDLSKDISVENIFIYGTVYFVQELFKRTPLNNILKKIIAEHPKLELPLYDIVFSLIVSRFLRPCSKLRLKEKWLERMYPELVRHDLSLHHIYRALDILAGHKGDIQKWLTYPDQQISLFERPKLEIVFYDTTTLRFESVCVDKDKLRRFGYSKEMRTDCTQVILGLLLDREGLPVGYRVFPGNTYEGKTVPIILKQLKEEIGIKRLVFVADRGMINTKNLDEVCKVGFEFIMGMKLWSMKKAEIKSIEQIKGWDLEKEEYCLKELEHPQGRLIVTWSKDRYQRDQQIRNDLLVKLRQKIKTDDKPEKLISHRGYKKYLKIIKQGQVAINEKAVQDESKRDGLFGILTNVGKETLPALEAVSRYKELWKIEDSFGEMKGTLQTRPMFHWTDRRIEGHMLLCFLAYYLEAYVTQQLRKAKASFTAPTAFDALNQVKAVPVQVRGKTLWVRTKIEDIAAQTLKILKIQIPGDILKLPSKTEV